MKVKVFFLLWYGILVFLSNYNLVVLGQPLNRELLNKRVEAVKIDAPSLHLALSELASKYGIPIGLETSLEENGEGKIILNIPEGTIKDVLNTIIQAAPGYEWKIVDGVVNVFPKENRDPILRDILETSVSEFTIKQEMSRLNIRSAITDLPEIKVKLSATNLTPLILATNSIDFREAGQNFSLKVRNTTIRGILNQIINSSAVKYWLVSRFGKRNEFLIVNL
jgi:hypothetical protein